MLHLRVSIAVPDSAFFLYSYSLKWQDLRFDFGQGVEVRLEAAFGSVRIAFPSLGRVVQVLSMGVPQALQQDTRRGGGSAVDPKTELKSERRE